MVIWVRLGCLYKEKQRPSFCIPQPIHILNLCRQYMAKIGNEKVRAFH